MRQKAKFLWIGLACVSCLAGPGSNGFLAADQGPGEANREQHKGLARRWIEEGFNKRDLKVVDEIFSEEFVVDGRRIGPKGLRQSMSRFLTAFPDLRVTITDLVAEGEKVGMWYTVQGTHRGEFLGVQQTARQVKWSGVDLLRVGGGKIVEGKFLDDSLGLLRQLGAMPPPSPSQTASPEDAARVRSVIEQHNADAVRWYAAGDVDSLVSIFAEDAWQMPPNSPALVGREAIRAYWREAVKRGKWEFSLQVQKVDVSGPLAVERGRYVVKFTAGQAAPAGTRSFEDRGNYVAQWRHEPNGQWLVVADAPVSELPIEPPPSSAVR